MSPATTCRASASDEVRPGDSMPNRFTSPATPCSVYVWMQKSAKAASGPWIFGRMPQ